MSSVTRAEMDEQSSEPAKRGGAEETKRLLVLHAQRAFTAAGFDDVGVREIAQEAGVNPSLVNRYFGGKQGLFEAVLASFPGPSAWFAIEKSAMGKELAKALAAKINTVPDVDPLLILLRSAQSRHVGEIVHSHMIRNMVEPMSEWQGNTPAAKAKARLVLAIILGVDVIERLISLPHHPEVVDDYVAVLGLSIQAILDA